MFFPERRKADIRSAIPASGDRRRSGGVRDPITGAPAASPAAAEHEAYWRAHYLREPYYERGYNFEDYHPAYRVGWEARLRHTGKRFEDVERELEAEYRRGRGASRLGWDKNRHAARAAWDRFDDAMHFETSQ